MIKTVTVSGITTVNFDPEGAQPYFYAANKYVWIRNDSEAEMYASLSSTCTAGADGTMKIGAGECGRIEIIPDNVLYLSGTGSAQIHTGDDPECPFKTAAKGGGDSSAVTYTEQTLTTAQRAQARENIGAASSTDVMQSDWAQYNSSEKDFIKNKPSLYPGHGMGGNIEGGTGGTSMNYTLWSNSVAYGYGANATANYTLAFGQVVSAGHDYEIAFGKYNVSSADTAFSIGDGAPNGDNHNLMELKTDGRLLLNGNPVAVLSLLTGYDATKTQTLKNINGNFTWVDDT